MPIGTDPQDSPLPSGGATAANQATQITEAQAANASLDAIETDADTIATNTTTANTKLDAANASLDAIEADADTIATNTTSIDGKLPTAATPADAVSNAASLTRILTWLQGFNGTTWDRARSGIADFSSDALASLVGTLRTLPVIQYLSTRPTLATGSSATLQANTRGDLAVQEQFAPGYEDNTNAVAWVAGRATSTSTGAWSRASSGATQVGTAGVSIKASAGRIRRIRVFSDAAAASVVMLFNKATAAVNADTPTDRAHLPAGGDYEFDYGPEGFYCSTGISIAFSTAAAPDSLTLFATSDFHYTVDYL